MPVNPLIIKLMSVTHASWYRLTGGAIGGSIGKAPILLLTTKGRKSGRPRTTPLLYLPDGDNFVIIASNGGHDRPPAWWLNLESDPQATVQIGRQKLSVMARDADGEDRERLWAHVVEMYPNYDEYQKSTARRIPVVVLQPES